MSLILNSKTARLMLVGRSHRAFFATYFSHYVSYPSADLHQQLFRLTEDDANRFAVVVTFRGSAKSTICSMSYPIWSILGRQKKHFVLIVGKTVEQARKILDAIKREFETNVMLQNDFGRVFEESTPWNTSALTFEKYDAQIAAISVEQSMRGIRYKHYRPDVFILDDVEDVSSVRMKESRDKLEEWLNTDLLPAGDVGSRAILIGNNLHEDSLPNRIIGKVAAQEFSATIIKCPLVDSNGVCAWPSKFPDEASIEALRRSFPSTKTWRQEYQLEIVPLGEQIISPTDIRYYDSASHKFGSPKYEAIGVDLARSLDEKADKTAFIPAVVEGSGADQKVYILPHIINARMEFPRTIKQCIQLTEQLGGKQSTRVFFESVAYQGVFGQQLKIEGVRHVTEYLPGRMDKNDRLYGISALIKEGKVLFPKNGAKELIEQLVNFGATKHDDLVDALTTLVLSVHGKNKPKSSMGMATGDFYHMEIVPFTEQMWQDIQIERKNIEDYIDYKGKMNSTWAKQDLRWNGYGNWQSIVPRPQVPPTHKQAQEAIRLRMAKTQQRKNIEKAQRLADLKNKPL